MFSKIYLKNGMSVSLSDGIIAREINSIHKEAVLEIDDDIIGFSRGDRKIYTSDYEEIGISRDENGFFFYGGLDEYY